MYQPENKEQFLDILTDLQHYAELEGLAGVGEMLSDALLMVVSDMHQDDQRVTNPGR